MKILSYIPIAIFVLDNTVYDFFYVPKNTHWSVAFFSLMYFSLLMWTINEAVRGRAEERIYFIVMSVGLFGRMILELSKWRLDYDSYMVSINDIEKSMLFAFLLMAGLSIVVFKLWKKVN